MSRHHLQIQGKMQLQLSSTGDGSPVQEEGLLLQGGFLLPGISCDDLNSRGSQRSIMPNFDAITIGTGQSGPALARRLVAAGRKVAIIERKLLGGTCVNTGSTPTKTLIASAYAAHVARRAGDYGITIEGPVSVDMKAVKT
jgi:hypothetical protein